jgi:carbonic anhydrase/acetyltransferase-like protein (isoleucine patch superfamily)
MVVRRYFFRLSILWAKFWMCHAGLSPTGRISNRLASCFSPPYKNRRYLARLTPNSYVSPKALISHNGLQLEGNAFLGDGVIIHKAKDGGFVKLAKGVEIHQDCIIETGQGGTISIGEDTNIQPRCHFSAYKGSIEIGKLVQIAPNCAFYPYDHGFRPGEAIKNQPLRTQGGIYVGDDTWLGVGVIVLDGSKIGNGAVIGAGSIVKTAIPDHAIAVGAPARVIRFRDKSD